MRIFSIIYLLMFICQDQNIDASNLTVAGNDAATISNNLGNHFQNHSAKGSLKWEDIQSLKTSTINRIASIGTTALSVSELSKIHEELSQTLKNTLIAEQYSPSTWLDKSYQISSSLVTLVLGATGAFAFDNPLLKSLAITGTVIGGVNTFIELPTIRNAIFRRNAGKLLPSYYGDEEIAIQSHLTALMTVAFDSTNISRLKDNQSNIKKHARHLKDYIVSRFKSESDSLVSYIDITATGNNTFPIINF